MAATVKALVGDKPPCGKMITVASRPAAKAVRIGKKNVLADSEATHEVRPLEEVQEIPEGARPMKLQLAVGQVSAWIDAEDTVWVDASLGVEELFPFGRYIKDCDLTISCSKQGGTLRAQDGQEFEVLLKSGCPYLHRDDLAELLQIRRRMLSARRRRWARAAVSQIKSKVELMRHCALGHPQFLASCDESCAASGRMRPHWKLDPDTRPDGELSVDISGPHTPGRWPTDLPEALPKRARYFLMAAYQVITQEELAEKRRLEQDAKACISAEMREPDRGDGGPDDEHLGELGRT